MKTIGKWMAILCCAIASIAQAGEWGYYVEGNGAVITSAPDDLSGAVTVPSQLGGRPVVSIGDWVGQDCDSITALTIPESVTNIGRQVFCGCCKLSSIQIGGKVQRIGAYSFRDTPFCETSSGKAEVCYLGDWTLGLKTLVAADEDDAYKLFYRRYGATVTAGTKHIADYAFERAHIRVAGNAYSDRSAGVGEIVLPDGMETIGEAAFNRITGASDVITSLVIPASVTRIEAHALACPMRKVMFKGKKPSADADVFESAYGQFEVEEVGPVYYDDSNLGWTYGGTWCGVKTYPWSWSEKRTSKITLGPAYEYDSDADEHELRQKEEVEDDEYVAIPVYGATSAAEINPVIVHHNSTAADIAAIEIRTDAQMFSAIVQPLLKCKSQWNSSGDYYYIYTSNAEGCWPTSLWPDNKAVSGRYWIVITPNSGTRYDMRDFRVGLFGTDEVTDRIYLANTGLGPTVCAKAFLDTNRVSYGGKSAPHIGYGQVSVLGNSEVIDAFGNTSFWTQGVKSASFTATVSEPGTFVLAGDDFDYSWNDSTLTGTYVGYNYKSQMTVSGGAISSDSEECHYETIDEASNIEWPNYDDYDDEEEYLDAVEEREAWQREILDVACTNMYWRHGGGSCIRRIAVSKGATYAFASKKHEDIDVNRLHFFPKSRRSVAVDAICMTARMYSSVCGHGNGYGYVLNSGVYVAGETVTFTAVPVLDNRFDHWEVAFADNHEALDAALRGKSLTSPTLSFVVTDAMCGEMAEEKQIVLRAVWKENRIPEIIPSPIGAATVSGNKEIFDGENVTVTLKPDANCSFLRWIDGADCGFSRTFSYDASGSDEPLYAIFSGTPVNPVPHIEVENLEDSYAVGAEIGPISVAVESGTGYSLTVAGLPTGLLYANGRITGTPTKTGSFTVTATATKSGASTLTSQFAINVTVEFGYEEVEGGICLNCPNGAVSGALVIPSSYAGQAVVAIGADFASGLGTITAVTISEGVLSVGDSAFIDNQITEICIPTTLTQIDAAAFGQNPLAKITVAAGNERYMADDAEKLLIDTYDNRVILSVKNPGELVIPEGVEAIGELAFEGVSPTSIAFPSTLETLEDSAFGGEGLKGVKTLDFSGTKLESVGVAAVFNCTTVSEIRFPSTLKSIGQYAFANCTSLKMIAIAGTEPDVPEMDAVTRQYMQSCYHTFYSQNPNGGIVLPTTVKKDVTIYVHPGQGWDAIVAAGTWQGCPIKMKTNIASEYGPYVPGEKVLAEVDELIGYTAKGLPTGLKLNSKTGEISGTPTKPTGDAGVTVTFTKKGAETLTATFIVEPLPTLTIATVGTGTIKGAGSYAANAKVSLKATAGKGQVFAGWYVADGGALGDRALPGGVDYRMANYSYVMPAEDVTLYAKFVSANEDTELAMENLEAEYEINSAVEMHFSVRSYSLPTVKVAGLPTGLKFDANTLVLSGTPTKPGKYTVAFTLTNLSNKKGVVEKTIITVPNIVSDKIGGLNSSANAYNYLQGVSIGDGITPKTADGYSLAVSGLPKGLSCDKNTGKITGAATALPGSYTVTFTAKKKGAATETATITINIESAPTSAVGVFNGFVGYVHETGFVNLGTFRLASSANGTLSAVIETANGKTTLTAKNWADVADDVFRAELTDKAGNTATIEIDVTTDFDAWQLSGSFNEVKTAKTYVVIAQMNIFGQTWYFKVAADSDDAWTLSYADSASDANLTVTTKADGSAALKGQLGSYAINATSFLATDGLRSGSFLADFVQFVTVAKTKKTLAIRTNLWFDGSDANEDGAGAARIVE